MRDLAASLNVSASEGKKNLKLPALREKVRPVWEEVLKERREAEAAEAAAAKAEEEKKEAAEVSTIFNYLWLFKRYK